MKITNKRKPEVTVAMAVFNGERYLSQSINSILDQTYKNFEFIILDDGSKDDSLNVIKHFAKLDKRIKILSTFNRGLSQSLNEIIRIANGKWIVRMDQDDISLPNRIENQISWLEKTSSDISGCYITKVRRFKKTFIKFNIDDESIKADILFGCPFAHPSVIYKASVIKKLKYDKKFEGAEDYDLWVRAAMAGYKMTNIPENLFIYRIHSNQSSIKNYTKQQELGNIIRLKYLKFYFKKNKLDIKKIKELSIIFNNQDGPVDLDLIDKQIFSFFIKLKQTIRKKIFANLAINYLFAGRKQSDVVFRLKFLQKKFSIYHPWIYLFLITLNIFPKFLVKFIVVNLRKFILWRNKFG